MSNINAQLRKFIQENPDAMVSTIASDHNVTELDVIKALPEEECHLLPMTELDNLLESLPTWGNMTTIITASGSIFEVKGTFPKGKYAHGYYNLITKGEGLHGHLKLDAITAIALISKPFMGTESHSINFIGSQGEIVFKVYLGRDKKRVLIPEQVSRFMALKQAAATAA